MATIEENLTLLKNTKSSIRQSIINKGVEVSDSDSFASYSSKIDEISTGGSGTIPVVGTDILVFNNNNPNINFSNYNFNNITAYNQFGNTSATTIGNVTTITNYAFSKWNHISNIDINFTNLTDGKDMFYESSIVTFSGSLPKLNTAENMFSRCSNLQTFNSNMPLIELTDSMFYECSNLQTFISDLSSLTSANQMFYGCTSLTNITLSGTLNCDDFNISYSTNLTVDSLMSVINALVDLSSESSKTLILGSANLAKLTDEQKAVATNKNWVLK